VGEPVPRSSINGALASDVAGSSGPTGSGGAGAVCAGRGCSAGPDGGVDLIAHTDPLGTTGPRIKVQVKRRDTEKVSTESLRAFMAVLGEQDAGIYVSAPGFSSQAEREARSQEKRRLKLIDLERFVELWVQHMQGLPDPDRQRLPLKPVYFLAAPE
jgi:restriction system protein